MEAAQQNIWLEKATFQTSDLTGGTDGGLLSNTQTKAFLRVAIDATTILKDARIEMSAAPTFEVPRISFGSRIMRAGTEGTRNTDGNRVAPTTGLASLTTVLLRGEVPISDEAFEDNIEKDRMADTIMTMVAEAVGRDIEELLLQGDDARIASEDSYLDLLDGFIKQMQSDTPAAQRIDMDAAGQPTTYEGMFAKAINAMPARYRKDVSRLRLYVPVLHADQYADALSARGTALGDKAVLENIKVFLAYRGVKVVEVPILTGTDNINNGAVDYDKFAFLTDPANLIVGFQRMVKIEKWRDPREGATSFVPSVRVDCVIAEPAATVLLYDIPTNLT